MFLVHAANQSDAMVFHSNDSVFVAAGAFAATPSNVSACVDDCVPDGFWILLGTAGGMLILMMSIMAWAASPRQCGACCCSVRRGFGDVWTGARQVLLETRGRRPPPAGGSNGQARDEIEDWWEMQPQTDAEKRLVAKQKEDKEKAEAEAKDE